MEKIEDDQEEDPSNDYGFSDPALKAALDESNEPDVLKRAQMKREREKLAIDNALMRQQKEEERIKT